MRLSLASARRIDQMTAIMNATRLITVFAALLFSIAPATSGSPLPSVPPQDAGVDPRRVSRVHELIESYVDEGKYAGAISLIARNGKIADWRAWGTRNVKTGAPMKKDTICRIYSMTKVITSVAALQLFEQGKVRLDSPVTDWLPELKHLKVFAGGTADAPQLVEVTNTLTIKMLLNHTGGFTYDFFGGSPVHELYKRADLWNSKSMDDFIRKTAQLPLLAQPGTAFHYGIGNDILGALIERVSGLPFEEYVARHITGPLKMNDTSFDVPKNKRDRVATLHELGPDRKLRVTEPILGAYADPGQGIASGGAGLFSTIGDYARFAQCLLNDGELDGARILGRKTVELARLNSLPDGVYAFSPADGWGLFSAVRINAAVANEPVSSGAFFWSGAATTHFFVDPTEKLIALVFCQHVPFDEHGLFTRFRTTVEQAIE